MQKNVSKDCECDTEAHTHNQAHKNDGCACGHSHGEAKSKNELLYDGVRIIAGVLLVFAARAVSSPWSLIIFILAYILVGGKVVASAVKNILRKDFFDENFLMSVATIGAFAIGDFTEAVAVMIFFEVGELLQGLAVARSRKNIASLMNIRPDFAVILKDGIEKSVAPEQVKLNDFIIVRPGEKIPLDCIVTQGESVVDTSALTGESVPFDALEGSSLIGGSINLTGALTCTVTSEYSESTVSKILKLVSEAGEKKAKAERLMTKLSKIYTPCVILAAILIAFVPPIFIGNLSEWFYRGLIFLVVSCPCALVVSIPVGFMGGIGSAAKNGILVKGGNVLDSLYSPKAVVFDKTGTLTKGSFAVQQVLPSAGISEEELKNAALLCEKNSNHPIATSIRAAFKQTAEQQQITKYEEISGMGISATTTNDTFYAGNAKLMEKVGIGEIITCTSATVLHIAKNFSYLGAITIADEIKENTATAILQLKRLGVEKCYMLTGDNEAVAADISKKAGLDGYKAGLLPHEKVSAFEELTKEVNGICMFAGDGINDAPLLARADVGIAMGGVGQAAAIEAADVVLMTDDISRIATSIRTARKTRAIVWQNIIFALAVKLAVLIVAAFGGVPMWLAIFADVGVALIAVANAARAVAGSKKL